jgi:hypothetical protein
MHTPEEPQRLGDILQQAQQIADAATDSEVGSVRTLTISICDVDIPCVISNGDVYVQTTLQGFCDAVQATMVEFLGSLEDRISEARRVALAHADFFPAVHFKRVAGEDVVRDSGEQR